MRWWKKPYAGDIVWCRFPTASGPVPKSRPALVVKVWEPEEGHFGVLVAYGTSQKTDQLHSGEFRIGPEEGDAYRLSGLSYATKFDLKKTLELPYHDLYFGVAPHGQQPKMGTLHPSLLRRVEAAMIAAGLKS